MKKIVNILVSVLLVVTLAGCDDDISNASNSDVSSTTEFKKIIINDPTQDNSKLKFSTVDIDGNQVTEEIIKDSKVVLINFWEPWCGPCVGEMPELEKLYENYRDKGLLIIGVFSTDGMEDDVKEILEYCGTTYPVIRGDINLAQYMTDYVPTTIFADSEGNILSDEPVIGANSYSDWEQILGEYLK